MYAFVWPITGEFLGTVVSKSPSTHFPSVVTNIFAGVISCTLITRKCASETKLGYLNGNSFASEYIPTQFAFDEHQQSALVQVAEVVVLTRWGSAA